MKPTNKNEAPRRPQQPTQPLKTEIPSSSVYGFPISINQFQSLEDSKFAESTSQLQSEDRLVNPRTTRLARQQAARRDAEQGTFGNLSNEGILYTVPPVRDAQGTFAIGDVDQPVASGIRSQFFPHSLSVSPSDILTVQSGGIVQNLLGTGAVVDDALYSSDVNDVVCTNELCNKRISYAGPERSTGRPGHTPIRRELACKKNIEDSCVGQDWSARRLGIRPFGASSAACPSPNTACLGLEMCADQNL